MSKKRMLAMLMVLSGSLALGACNDVAGIDDIGRSGENARVSLMLTDAPGDLEAAVVTITDIYLQGDGDEDGGRVYLRQGDAVTTNLLTLSNDAVQLVDSHEIPAGSYSQLRFVITGAYLEVGNGDGGTTIYATSPDYEGLPPGTEVDGKLKCPSCAQSGFKVLLTGLGDDTAHVDDDQDDQDAGIILDGEETLLVDFDVAGSFGHPAGKSGKWVMHPTLRATHLVNAANLDVTLALANDSLVLPVIGETAVTLGQFSATLTPVDGGEAKTIAFTDANADGVYEAKFGYLFPGDYEVGLTSVAGLTFATDVALPVPVTVDEGADVTVALKLTGATATEAGNGGT